MEERRPAEVADLILVILLRFVSRGTGLRLEDGPDPGVEGRCPAEPADLRLAVLLRFLNACGGLGSS